LATPSTQPIETDRATGAPAAPFPGEAIVLAPEPRLPDDERPRRSWLIVKRGLDAAVAALLLVVLAPLMAIISLLVRATSPGPVIFRQVRCGRDGRQFTVYKFRTMWADADPVPHVEFIEQLALDALRAPSLKKLTRDRRVTPVGRILRRTSLDELPQLVNVLEGSMSLIGPRPVPLYELQYYREHHYERFRVRPGITGLWQVSGRSGLGFYEMLELDMDYVRRCGPALDAGIALRTPVALLRSRTA
jgi:lipopolysaccharide/colanic/teichoic acid biosynthesis glycosyltransferase